MGTLALEGRTKGSIDSRIVMKWNLHFEFENSEKPSSHTPYVELPKSKVLFRPIVSISS